MVKKDDLRVIKTKKLIKDTFLKLKHKLPLEKIRVSTLCEMAQINKSTFYKHYINIDDLFDNLQRELIIKILNDFDAKDKLFSSPNSFIEGFPLAINKNKKELETLIKDTAPALFFRKFAITLKEIYMKNLRSPEDEIILSFILFGTLISAGDLYKKFEPEIITKVVSQQIQTLSPNLSKLKKDC